MWAQRTTAAESGGKGVPAEMVEDHDDDGSGDGGGDGVVGRRRNAHAQDQGHEHGEDEGEEELSSGVRHQDLSELEAKAGLGDHADDDARAGVGRDDSQGAPGPFLQQIDDHEQGHDQITPTGPISSITVTRSRAIAPWARRSGARRKTRLTPLSTVCGRRLVCGGSPPC